jgi:hypothetical protein
VTAAHCCDGSIGYFDVILGSQAQSQTEAHEFTTGQLTFFKNLFYLQPAVGIVTRRHNGVTNWPLPILFKTITSYKSSGFTLLKALSVV